MYVVYVCAIYTRTTILNTKLDFSIQLTLKKEAFNK